MYFCTYPPPQRRGRKRRIRGMEMTNGDELEVAGDDIAGENAEGGADNA